MRKFFKDKTEMIYEKRANILMFISVMFHISDIVTDIIVTNDLYNEKSFYFTISLGILIFSFVGSSLLSLGDEKFLDLVRNERNTMVQESKCNKFVLCGTFTYFLKMIYWMILDITQINYFNDCYCSIFRDTIVGSNYTVRERLLIKRMRESLLESGPEALLQLFLILNQSNSKTFIELLTYYISVKMSLLSLTYTLVSMDYFYLTNVLKRFKNNDICPSYLSKYSLNSILFRFTEVFSRVGLLACVGQMYDGYYLFLFISTDYITLNVLNVLKRCIRYRVEKCEFSSNSLKMVRRSNYIQHYRRIARKIMMSQYRGNDGLLDYLRWRDTPNIIYSGYKILLCWRIYKKDKVKNIFKLKTTIQQQIIPIYKKSMDTIRVDNKVLERYKKEIYDSKIWIEMMSVTLLVDNIKKMGVYYRPLSYNFEREIRKRNTRDFFKYVEFPVNIPDSNKWWNRISTNFISKYINNACITILLIYNLLTESNSVAIVFISISSMICYLINIMSLSFITKWNNKNESEFIDISTKPLINIKCKTICCFDCNKKDNEKTNKKENTIIEEII